MKEKHLRNFYFIFVIYAFFVVSDWFGQNFFTTVGPKFMIKHL